MPQFQRSLLLTGAESGTAEVVFVFQSSGLLRQQNCVNVFYSVRPTWKMSLCGGYNATACRDPRGALASIKVRVHGDVSYIRSFLATHPLENRPPPPEGLHNEGYEGSSPNIETARLAYGSQVTIQYCNYIVNTAIRT